MARWIDDLTEAVAAEVEERAGARTAHVFRRCFSDALDNAARRMPDGTVFLVTGDIPAMWLRDSTAQLAPYLHFAAGNDDLRELLVAVNRRQLDFISIDPYANAFNAAPDGAGHGDDETDGSPWVWERKYEIDSLCYPLQLAHDLWEVTGTTSHLDERYRDAARAAIAVWRTEQDHEARSPYRFQRHDAPASDTLVREGRGRLVAPTGMTWAGFRPSDDACEHGYNVPGNAFASVTLAGVAAIAAGVLRDEALAADALALRADIERGIRAHGVVEVDGSAVLAYEVDGLGSALVMDDANVPSLLSLPLLGWCAEDDPLYLSTRSVILSERNPSYQRGAASRGIGSPHTPPEHIWPIALAVEGLTTSDEDERRRILETLLTTDAGTGVMHESFHRDDPSRFTRPWFSWANAMFCELVLDMAGMRTRTRRVAQGVAS